MIFALHIPSMGFSTCKLSFVSSSILLFRVSVLLFISEFLNWQPNHACPQPVTPSVAYSYLYFQCSIGSCSVLGRLCYAWCTWSHSESRSVSWACYARKSILVNLGCNVSDYLQEKFEHSQNLNGVISKLPPVQTLVFLLCFLCVHFDQSYSYLVEWFVLLHMCICEVKRAGSEERCWRHWLSVEDFGQIDLRDRPSDQCSPHLLSTYFRFQLVHKCFVIDFTSPTNSEVHHMLWTVMERPSWSNASRFVCRDPCIHCLGLWRMVVPDKIWASCCDTSLNCKRKHGLACFHWLSSCFYCPWTVLLGFVWVRYQRTF